MFRWNETFSDVSNVDLFKVHSCKEEKTSAVVSDFILHGQVIKGHTRYAWQSKHFIALRSVNF